MSNSMIVTVLLIVAAILPGAYVLLRTDSSASPAEIKEVPLKNLHVGPVRHEDLSEDLIQRIRRLPAVFVGVTTTPIDEWIDDFKRDAHPENEVAIWESIANAYQTVCANRPLDDAARKELYDLLLLRSMKPETDVRAQLKPGRLTRADVDLALASYNMPAEPLSVTSENSH
jgi:hypothetical protein